MVVTTESIPASGAPIRVGLLLDSWAVPAWVARIVDDIRSAPFAEISVVVLNATPPWARSVRRVLEKRHQLLWRAYMAADARLFRVPHNPFTRRNLEVLLSDVPVVQVSPEKKLFSDYFPVDAIQELREKELDVVFRFGFRILRGDVLGVARHGIWSFHHGDSEVNRGSPAGFWEVVQGEPVTGSVLQVLTADLDDGQILYRSWSSTHPYSVLRNRARLYNKSAAFAIRCLRDLHATGEVPVPPVREGSGFRPYSHALQKIPTTREMVPILVRLAARGAGAAVRKLVSRGSWFIAYRLGDPERLPRRFYDFKPLAPPRGRLWADPFPVVHQGRNYIFFEEWSHGSERAHISVLEVNADGSHTRPAKVLERPYHLSYPFIFRWDGGFFMIPETRANRTVELYRATDFPTRWELEKVLLSGVEAVDATVEEVGGRWWMFVNMAEPGASVLDELHLYHADSPLGPWQPHARNPVKSDVRSARPAGRLFRVGEDLIRPAQDGSVRYGYAVTFNRITRLTLDEFREEEVAKLLPHWRPGLLGTHTFNHEGGLSVVDGYRQARRWP